MKRLGQIFVVVALPLAGAIYLAICTYAASVLSVVPRNFDPDVSPARFGLEYRDVRFPSRMSGLELAGWYLPSPGSTWALVMVHGLADTSFPPSSAERLAAALPGAEVWLVPGAEHSKSYQTAPEAYVARVGDFFARHIPEARQPS